MYGALFNEGLAGPPYLAPVNQGIIVASGTDDVEDFPLTGWTPVPYVTQTDLQTKIGGPRSVVAATDDLKSGSLNATVLAAIITQTQQEIDALLSPAYHPPYQRRYTVATFRVQQVSTDGLGKVLAITPRYIGPKGSPDRTCGYYLTAPAPIAPGTTVATVTFCEKASGLALIPTFTQRATTEYVCTSVAIGAAGTGYREGEIVGLVGGSSFLPPIILSAAQTIAAFETQRRRLAPRELNIFGPDHDRYVGTATQTGILRRCGNGEEALGADWPRAFTPGFAFVQHNRLTDTTL